MTKEEFLSKLRSSLANDFPGSEVENQVNYYFEYINDEMRKGRTEKEVLDELGDPWIIARSLVNAAEDQIEEQYTGFSGYEDADTDYKETYQRRSYQTSDDSELPKSGRIKMYLMEHPRLMLGLMAVGFVLVFALVISIIMGIFSFLAPVLVPILVVLFVVRLITGDRYRRW